MRSRGRSREQEEGQVYLELLLRQAGELVELLRRQQVGVHEAAGRPALLQGEPAPPAAPQTTDTSA